MPTPTYTPLANLTLSTTASTVTFSSISQSYRDLVLVMAPIGTAGTNDYICFNSDSGSNYQYIYMGGNGSAASTTSTFAGTSIRLEALAYIGTTAGTTRIINIMDYSATDKYKSILSRSDYAAAGVEARVGTWANTAAITNIQIALLSSTFAAGSSFALYGIVA